VLELAILGLLKEQPMHGYDLRKRLRADFGLLSSLSFGSLYPALARLQTAGAVREVDSEHHDSLAPVATTFTSAGSIAGEKAAFRARLASRRTVSTHSGGGTRARRVYELTPRGEELFHHLLETQEPKPADERGFELHWAFARYLSPEGRISLLQRRRGQLVAAKEGTRRAVESPWQPLDRYQRSLVDHASEAAEHDLGWIDRLIANERATQEVAQTSVSSPSPTQPNTDLSHVANAAVAAARATSNNPTIERSEP
jgi:DNA-binding PadR family transcriptional regulator